MQALPKRRRAGSLAASILTGLALIAAPGCGGDSDSSAPTDTVVAVASRTNTGGLVLIDAVSGATIATIPTTARPATDVAVTPDRRFAYVTGVQGATQTANVVSVVDLGTRAEVATIPVPSPLGIVMHPDGSRAYVTSRFGNSIAVLDLSTNTVAKTITGTAAPHYPAMDEAGAHLYVPVTNGIVVIRTSDDTEIGRMSRTPGSNNFQVALSRDGSRVFTSDGPSGVSVSAFSATAPFAKITSVGMGSPIRSLSVGYDGRLYAAINDVATVGVLDPITLAQVGTIDPSPIDLGLAIAPQRFYANRDGARLYLSMEKQGRVYILDLVTGDTESSVPFAAPGGMSGF